MRGLLLPLPGVDPGDDLPVTGVEGAEAAAASAEAESAGAMLTVACVDSPCADCGVLVLGENGDDGDEECGDEPGDIRSPK